MRSSTRDVLLVVLAWGLLASCSSNGSGQVDGGTEAGIDASGSDGNGSDAGTPTHFGTLPVGATVQNGQLPTEAQCTAWVNQAAPGLDATETMPCNAMYNSVSAVPPSSWLTALHTDPEADSAGHKDAEWQVFRGVSGNFYGSTDMILRWAACKWGIDEDVVRAEAVEESSWKQSEAAGCGSTTCTGQGSDPPAASAANYWVAATDDPSSQTQGGTCCPTKGILQVGFPYWYAYPYGVSSTALNADYRMAAERACMNGDVTWLDGTNGGSGSFGTYPPTDTNTALYGCMGHWYSGSWNDSGAVQYVTQLQTLLGQQAWKQVSCQ